MITKPNSQKEKDRIKKECDAIQAEAERSDDFQKTCANCFDGEEQIEAGKPTRLWCRLSLDFKEYHETCEKWNQETEKLAPVIDRKIQYAGKTLTFILETESTDEAQALINHEQKLGRLACCKHERGKHQFYAEIKEPNYRDEKFEKDLLCMIHLLQERSTPVVKILYHVIHDLNGRVKNKPHFSPHCTGYSDRYKGRI
jgi:uncharacterized protein YukE